MVVQCSIVFMLWILIYRTVSVQVRKLKREGNHWRKELISDEFHAPQFSFHSIVICVFLLFFGAHRPSHMIFVPFSCMLLQWHSLGILVTYIAHIAYMIISTSSSDSFGQTFELSYIMLTVPWPFPCLQWNAGLWTAMSHSNSSFTFTEQCATYFISEGRPCLHTQVLHVLVSDLGADQRELAGRFVTVWRTETEPHLNTCLNLRNPTGEQPDNIGSEM